MSKKRFTMEEADYDTIYFDKDDVMTEKEVLDTLNYLHKENKQLKKRLMICQDKIKGLMG